MDGDIEDKFNTLEIRNDELAESNNIYEVELEIKEEIIEEIIVKFTKIYTELIQRRETETKHKCNFCSFKGKSDQGLKVHMKTKHKEEKNCLKGDPLNSYYGNQQRCITCFPITDTENYCQQCHTDFDNYDGFINHSEFNHVNDIYTCERCKHTFETRKSLYRHIETDHCDNIHF